MKEMTMTNEVKKFCKENGIPTNLDKRWYEHIFRFCYQRRQKKYEYSLRTLYIMMQELEDARQTFWKKFIHDAEKFSKYGIKFQAKDKKIDFSDLWQAADEIAEMTYYFKETIWIELEEQLLGMRKKKQKEVLKKGISELPEDKDVLLVYTGYRPYSDNVEAFEKSVETLKQSPEKRLVSIRCIWCPEWMAFCPRFYEASEIEGIIEKWTGDPLTVTLSYK